MRLVPTGPRCGQFEVLAKACGHEIIELSEQRMTVKEAAKKWRKSQSTIRRWCRLRHVPCEKIGRTLEIPADAKPPRF